MHIKDVNVTNPKNVLVQIPGFIVNKWGVSTESQLEVHYDEERQAVIIGPKELRLRSAADKQG